VECLQQGSIEDGFLNARIQALDRQRELLAPGPARDKITAQWREKFHDSRSLRVRMEIWRDDLKELERDRVAEKLVSIQHNPIKGQEQEDDGPMASHRRELVAYITKGQEEIESDRLRIEQLNREEEGLQAQPDPIIRAQAGVYVRRNRSMTEEHMSQVKQQVRGWEEALDALDNEESESEDNEQSEAEGGDTVVTVELGTPIPEDDAQWKREHHPGNVTGSAVRLGTPLGEDDAQSKMEDFPENATGSVVPESPEDPAITKLRKALVEEIRELTDEPDNFILSDEKIAERIAEKQRKLDAITPRKSQIPPTTTHQPNNTMSDHHQQTPQSDPPPSPKQDPEPSTEPTPLNTCSGKGKCPEGTCVACTESESRQVNDHDLSSNTAATGAVRFRRSRRPPANRGTGLRGGCPAPQENNDPASLQNEEERQAAEDELQK
jgi:hypothetical protein